MWNKYSIAVYDQKENDWTKIENYLKKAASFGCKEVFTSAHMPENKMDSQINFVLKLADLAHQNKMELTVDFGGASLHHLLMNAEKYPNLKIDYVRMDYGYEASIMEEMGKHLKITGFVWNASTIDETVLDSFLSVAQKHPNYRIRACHNFYPRKETALERNFLLSQNRRFHAFNIPVTTCIPNPKAKRAPLFEGLPSLEDHRSESFEKAALDCMHTEIADDILIGDLWLDDEQFAFLNNLLNEKVLELKVSLKEGLSEKERAILFKHLHHIRYDSNHLVLRSQSSREMAEYAEEIEPFNEVKRLKNSLTIDNKKYGRYSGELQFILQDLEADERVNVVGEISEDDAWKLEYYRYGFRYKLIEGGTNE